MTQPKAETTSTYLLVVLTDWHKREAFRAKIAADLNAVECHTDRFFNPAMDSCRAALRNLKCEVDAFEYNERRLTDPYVKEAAQKQIRAERLARARKIAARLATAKALIAAYNERVTLPSPDPHEAIQRETERRLQEFLDSRNSLPLPEAQPAKRTMLDKREYSKAMRQMFAVAREHGLNINDSPTMRGGINEYFFDARGDEWQAITSRRQLQDVECREIAHAIRNKVFSVTWKILTYKTRQRMAA